jgi:hypothetical protein
MPAVQTLGPQASSLLPGNKFSGEGKKDDLRLNLQLRIFYMSPRWGWLSNFNHDNHVNHVKKHLSGTATNANHHYDL